MKNISERAAFVLTMALAAFSTAGCSLLSGGSNRTGIWLDVPFVEQEPSQCGVAALEMVLAFHGVDPRQNTDLEQAFFPVLGGSTPEMLAHVVSEAGLPATVHQADLAQLDQWLGAELPVIALFRQPNEPVGHFVVVTGRDAKGTAYWLHSGRRRHDRMDRMTFFERWAGSRCTAVVVHPPFSKCDK